MSRKVLVTGAAGQLGRSLVTGLSDNFEVIPTVHKNKDGVHFKVEILNISESQEVKRMINSYSPDIVINCAAMTNVDLCESNHTDAWDINVSGLENIIKFTNKNTHIIQISSDYVFDGDSGPYSESDPTYPVNYYGKTKLAAENLLIGSQRKHLILRPNVLYSSDLSLNNFFSWTFWSLSEKKEIQVVTDQMSNPTWTSIFSDVVREFIIFRSEGIYHYGSDNYLSRYEFALEIAEIFNFDSKLITPVKSSDLSQIAIRPTNSGLNISKVEEEMDITTYSTDYCLKSIRNALKVA